MSAVWVVRPPVMNLQWPVRYFSDEGVARAVLQSHHEFGIDSTLTRETLLTPEHERVIAAAKNYAAMLGGPHDVLYGYAQRVFLNAVNALRAQEGA